MGALRGRRPPSSRKRRVCRRRGRGFTLLELMVVIVLAGILLAIVSVNATPDPRQQLQREAQRIGRLVGVAADEARLTSQRITWEADLRGYRFFAESGDERRLLTDDLLRERPWDRPLQKLALFEAGADRPTQVVLTDGAPAVRLEIGREWIQPPWRLEIADAIGRVTIDFDAAGRSRVATQ